MRFSLALFTLLALATPALAQLQPRPQPLYAKTFGATKASRVSTLIVVLHGDAALSSLSYHYAFAEAAARAIPKSAAVAILRPGYEDAAGNRSPGERGSAAGDNYDISRIGMVARSIIDLRKRYRRANIILVGESGGAAIAADLAGTYPGLVDGMLLVSCPCTLPEWRRHMEKQTPEAPFETPVLSLDPLQTSGGIAPSLRTTMVVGEDDQVTLPRFSRTYAEALALRGIAVDFRILPAKGHGLLNDPQVLEALVGLVAVVPARAS